MYGQIAQMVEQRTENPCVAGSIPALAIFSENGQRESQTIGFRTGVSGLGLFREL